MWYRLEKGKRGGVFLSGFCLRSQDQKQSWHVRMTRFVPDLRWESTAQSKEFKLFWMKTRLRKIGDFCSYTQRMCSNILIESECCGRSDTYGRPEIVLYLISIGNGHRLSLWTRMGRPVFCIVSRAWHRGFLSKWSRTVSAFFHLSIISNGRYLTSHSPGKPTTLYL